jgi:hypothetical protein
VASPILLSLLLASQTPDYPKTIAALEEAYASSQLPEVLLSIATTYERWPDHCQDAVAAYQRFFTACGKCDELARAVDRFDLTLERCVSSADEEAAIREQYVIPSRKAPARRPADATRSELVDLLRRGRSIDRAKVNNLFVTLIEAGLDAPIDRLNALREDAWDVLVRADADAEQVLSMVARLKDVEPPLYPGVLDALMQAERNDDQPALNAVRLQAIAILRQNSSDAPPASKPLADGCVANPVYELGYLTINTQPWSEVYVNGEKIGTTPVARYKVVAGCATVRAINPETGKELVTNVTVRPNRVSILKLDLN